jgi:4-methyl-5(b-hydroxyethyl)-thiazole monophosphate biosynthesis
MASICVVLADGFEEVEAITPVDWLRRAGARVVLAGLSSLAATGARGVSINCDAPLETLDPSGFDCVVLPGGLSGAKAIAASPLARRFVEAVDQKGGIVAAICAAPAVALGAWGMLRGRRWTCYPGLEKGIPDGLHEGAKAVRDGALITGSGPGAASEFALAIVEATIGMEAAEKVRAATLS